LRIVLTVGRNLARVNLEFGGKALAIVLASADLDFAKASGKPYDLVRACLIWRLSRATVHRHGTSAPAPPPRRRRCPPGPMADAALLEAVPRKRFAFRCTILSVLSALAPTHPFRATSLLPLQIE
jgi:hypothetical protein